MVEKNINSIQNFNNRVTVHVTKDVAYSLEKMTKITASVLAKLGCGGCHSGRILDFHVIEEFVVNPKTLEVRESVGGVQF